MASRRESGILLHPTSLPGRFGIGDLGPAAYAFADLLASAGQRLWQVLPLGPTGYGDSPYQCFSAFAGNPLLISLDVLIQEGLLNEAETDVEPTSGGAAGGFPPGPVDYARVIAHRRRLWPVVSDRFEAAGASPSRDRFDRFCAAQASWLDDFALFMALKDAHGQTAWTAWERDIAGREPDAVVRWTTRLAREIRLQKLTQFLFFEQWQRLRAYCRSRSIEILGDLPIFVAHDSADVWARRELFRLHADHRPAVVAGVPPDYFSATGQLWGNPHYRWDVLEKTGYAWWVDRFRALLALVDRVRIDHFRGFVAAWEIPSDATTAVVGSWQPGPGAALFSAVKAALRLDALPFVAENLGVITPDVEALRRELGLPGMAILQFAFGTDPQAPSFRPHNYARETVVYTGTHDNDTTVGWWSTAVGHSTRSDRDVQREREYASRYLQIDSSPVHWAFIRAALASVAQTAIVPAQDLLGLGSDARMNQPATPNGNWRWRLLRDQLTAESVRPLAVLAETYERI